MTSLPDICVAQLPDAGFDWDRWTPTVRATLMFVIDRHDPAAPRVLLIEKLRGFGMGKVNGPGGKIDPGETPLEAAVRETIEETGIEPIDVEPCGTIAFAFRDGLRIGVNLFRASRWQGDLRACEEADPFWCAADAIPWRRMWQDDHHWLPTVLDGGTVSARFGFDQERMIECHLILDQQ